AGPHTGASGGDPGDEGVHDQITILARHRVGPGHPNQWGAPRWGHANTSEPRRRSRRPVRPLAQTAMTATATGSPGLVPGLHDRVVRRRSSTRRTVRVSPRLSSRPVTSAARRCLGFVYAWRRDGGGGYGVVVAPPADVA